MVGSTVHGAECVDFCFFVSNFLSSVSAFWSFKMNLIIQTIKEELNR